MVKTMAVINVLLATMWTAVAVVLLAQKIDAQDGKVLLLIIAIYALMIWVPATTAWTLFKSNNARAASRAIKGNYSFIALAFFSFAGVALTKGWAMVVVAATLLMLPQWLSVKALKRVIVKVKLEANRDKAFNP
jgi:hypothetical protein